MTRSKATAIGATAIVMWSLLALFTIGSAPVPPFLLSALTFAVAGIVGLIWSLKRGLTILKSVPLRVYAFGTIGLFGYHALYFTAFRLGPSAETGLIAYLWPLFIVLFSGLLPGESLHLRHILGALIAFAGAAVLIWSPTNGAPPPTIALLLAFLCALTWASYSVLSRGLGDVPTESVTVFCLATALLSVLSHLAFETTLWPATPLAWASVLGLGLFPVGLAFFTWDIGMKKGDIQLLGVASYLAPLLSTLALVIAGISQARPILLLAAVLIAAGAAIAAYVPRARP
jgi:drug/metabolite transporter (DMT)-like permease